MSHSSQLGLISAIALMLMVSSATIATSQPTPRPATTWLDQAKPTNWNQPNSSPPKAPTGGANLKQCTDAVRQPITPEDRSLIANGWTLFGALQTINGTLVITGVSDFDGMCRPLGYQHFVFVRSKFAGTLSPTLMNSRTDGASRRLDLYRAKSFQAVYSRYSDSDPLCCPSRTSYVSFEIDTQNGSPVVVPADVVTQAGAN